MYQNTKQQKKLLSDIQKVYDREFPNYKNKGLVLSHEKFLDLFKKFKEEGDLNARDLILKSQLKLTYHYTRITQETHNLYKFSTDDMMSYGFKALIKLLDDYKPEKNSKFPTYLRNCLWKTILKYVGKDSNTIRLPSNVIEDRKKQKKAISPFYNQLGREPIDGDTIYIKGKEIKFNKHIRFNISSTDTIINENGDTISDLLEDKDTTFEIDENVKDNAIRRIISNLPLRAKEILEMCIMNSSLSKEEIVQRLTPIDTNEWNIFNKRSLNILKIQIGELEITSNIYVNHFNKNLSEGVWNLPKNIKIQNLHPTIKTTNEQINFNIITNEPIKLKLINTKGVTEIYPIKDINGNKIYSFYLEKGFLYSSTNLEKQKRSILKELRMNPEVIALKY